MFRVLAFPARRALFLLASIMSTNLAYAQDKESSAAEAVDTEHIFGFVEGSDIGEKGEKEIDHSSYIFAGKPGSFVAILNETDFRYDVDNGFRASLNLLTDYHGVYDSSKIRKSRGFCLQRPRQRARLGVGRTRQSALSVNVVIHTAVAAAGRHFRRTAGKFWFPGPAARRCRAFAEPMVQRRQHHLRADLHTQPRKLDDEPTDGNFRRHIIANCSRKFSLAAKCAISRKINLVSLPSTPCSSVQAFT